MKADYKGFCEEVDTWSESGLSYGLNDLIALAKKYEVPIPIEVKSFKNPTRMVERLVELWRKAENYYINTFSGWQKERLARVQAKLNLTDEQEELLEEWCTSEGI